MSENKKQQFTACLKEQSEKYIRFWRQLEAEGRKEEAVFVSIRLNIYDIFKAAFSAIQKGHTDDEIFVLFPAKVEQISGGWQNSLDKAREQNDQKKIRVEAEKLEAAADVKEMFYTVWNETV